jgi:hypothetical protein
MMNDEVFISPGNDKLGKIPNVSLSPGLSCGNNCICREKLCYAKRIYNRYPAVRKRWDDNLTLAITDPLQYFASIHRQLPSLKSEYFRWHVGGDILTQGYLDSMMVIAADFPKMKFLCFTKQYYLSFARSPRNLRIVLSAWPGYPMPRSSLPVAYMQNGAEHRVPPEARICSGTCNDCYDCWDMKRGDAVVFHVH